MTHAGASAGYSLIEVMITLAVLALAASVVTPGLSSGMDSASIRSARLQAESAVMAIRRLAIRNDQSIAIAPSRDTGSSLDPGRLARGAEPKADIAMRLELPDGWTYTLGSPVRVRPDGTCSSADLDLVREASAPIRLRVSGSCSLLARTVR